MGDRGERSGEKRCEKESERDGVKISDTERCKNIVRGLHEH